MKSRFTNMIPRNMNMKSHVFFKYEYINNQAKQDRPMTFYKISIKIIGKFSECGFLLLFIYLIIIIFIIFFFNFSVAVFYNLFIQNTNSSFFSRTESSDEIKNYAFTKFISEKIKNPIFRIPPPPSHKTPKIQKSHF